MHGRQIEEVATYNVLLIAPFSDSQLRRVRCPRSGMPERGFFYLKALDM